MGFMFFSIINKLIVLNWVKTHSISTRVQSNTRKQTTLYVRNLIG